MIWRSLNGAYDLVHMIESQYYDKKTSDIKIQYKKDLSHFYKTVIVSLPEININRILKQNNHNQIDFESIAYHPYFNKLINNEFKLEDFLRSQIPFFHAVVHWLDVLINVANKLKEQNQTELHDLIYENINDEKGLCECSDVSHKETFLGFLQGLADELYAKWSIPDIQSEAVAQFNNELDKMVETKSITYICACLGTIEYLYIDISKIIKDYVDYYGIRQSHYTLHEILDTKHSSDLFKIADLLNNNILSDDILNGIIFGHQIFLNLYKNMLEY
jgi:pyrroloquinoline-quinone synthase